VIVTVDGIKAICPFNNCDYVIQELHTPVLKEYIITGNTMELTFENATDHIKFSHEQVQIRLGVSNCVFKASTMESDNKMTCDFA
jgi:hypothetical protein